VVWFVVAWFVLKPWLMTGVFLSYAPDVIVKPHA